MLTQVHRGVTYCSPPVQYYWFNPVEVLVNELLAGARIALPTEVVTILTLLRIGSQVMYTFFMAGSILNAVLFFGTPLVMLSRWWSLITIIISGLAGILLTIAAVIATVISIAARIALTAQDQLNISADVGVLMFAFMWVAAIVTLLAFFMQLGLCCCCTDRHRHKMSEKDKPA